jgi:general secretion pathway protein G
MKKTQGFTLVELMIVIVILGVLMAAIIPRIGGAQDRARDMARNGDLNSIKSALNMYYSDYGQYPDAADDFNAGECLGDSGDTAYDALKTYIEGEQVPTDPSNGANGYLCSSDTGRYWYKPLIKNGVDNNSYILCADAETYQKANTIVNDKTGAKIVGGTDFTGDVADTSNTTFADFKTAVNAAGGDNVLTADTDNQTYSLYCILGD